MSEMILPENGSVLIIDDQPKQALPILQALSKKGISATYYRGVDDKELPENPVQSVRMAFVDLQLFQTDNDPHNIATRIVHILKKLISSENGPYMLLIWSLKKHRYGQALKDEISKETNGIIPACIIELEKDKCIQRKGIALEQLEDFIGNMESDLTKSFAPEDVEAILQSIRNNWVSELDAEYEIKPDAIEVLEKNIKAELEKAGVFHLFIIWENLIKNSAAQTVAQISATLTHDDSWEQNMRDVFRRMGIARVGQNKVSDKELLKESILTFIQSFTDNLEAEIQQVQLPDYTSQPGEQLLKMDYEGTSLRLVEEEDLVRIYRDIKNEEKNEVTSEKLYEGKDIYKLDSSVSKSKDVEKQKAGNNLLRVYQSVPPRLNTGLHIEQSPTNVLVPGNIYEVNVKEGDRSKFADTYFVDISGDELKLIRFIELEVSPICDYAQKKWKRCRLISGVIYPESLVKKIRAQNDHLYKAHPVFFLGNENVKMVFDYHLFKSREKQEIRGRTTLIYRLRRELLLDIIANVSAHVNRPGISFVA